MPAQTRCTVVAFQAGARPFGFLCAIANTHSPITNGPGLPVGAGYLCIYSSRIEARVVIRILLVEHPEWVLHDVKSQKHTQE